MLRIDLNDVGDRQGAHWLNFGVWPDRVGPGLAEQQHRQATPEAAAEVAAVQDVLLFSPESAPPVTPETGND